MPCAITRHATPRHATNHHKEILNLLETLFMLCLARVLISANAWQKKYSWVFLEKKREKNKKLQNALQRWGEVVIHC